MCRLSKLTADSKNVKKFAHVTLDSFVFIPVTLNFYHI